MKQPSKREINNAVIESKGSPFPLIPSRVKIPSPACGIYRGALCRYAGGGGGRHDGSARALPDGPSPTRQPKNA
eukprot:1057074-Pyramimonas_sp.AAC.1